MSSGSQSVVERNMCEPAKNSIPVQASKTLPTISPFYGVNPFINRRCVGNILSEKRNGKMRSVKV
jgi:hypothetical protein